MKKAQIQNMESIAVVIIVAILVVLGIVFAATQKSDSVDRDRELIQQLESNTIAIRVAGLREIKCSSVTEAGNVCLDFYKVKSMEDTIKDTSLDADKYYFDLFHNSKIEIRPIYPKVVLDQNDNSIKTITIYDYEPTTDIETQKSSVYPILLSDTLNNRNIFALMEIKVYK